MRDATNDQDPQQSDHEHRGRDPGTPQSCKKHIHGQYRDEPQPCRAARCLASTTLAGDGEAPGGVRRADALARFHVADAEGRVRAGARAFAEFGNASPGGWRILGHIAAVPPFV